MVGTEEQWAMVVDNLEAAKSWIKSCENMEGSSAMRRDAAEFAMEIRIFDGAVGTAAPVACGTVDLARREEEVGTDGAH